MLGYLFLLVAGVVLATGLLVRKQVRRKVRDSFPAVDDDALRRILDEGRLETDADEPLDLEEIRKEEERFWDESWDEPDGPYHP